MLCLRQVWIGPARRWGGKRRRGALPLRALQGLRQLLLRLRASRRRCCRPGTLMRKLGGGRSNFLRVNAGSRSCPVPRFPVGAGAAAVPRPEGRMAAPAWWPWDGTGTLWPRSASCAASPMGEGSLGRAQGGRTSGRSPQGAPSSVGRGRLVPFRGGDVGLWRGRMFPNYADPESAPGGRNLETLKSRRNSVTSGGAPGRDVRLTAPSPALPGTGVCPPPPSPPPLASAPVQPPRLRNRVGTRGGGSRLSPGCPGVVALGWARDSPCAQPWRDTFLCPSGLWGGLGAGRHHGPQIPILGVRGVPPSPIQQSVIR